MQFSLSDDGDRTAPRSHALRTDLFEARRSLFVPGSRPPVRRQAVPAQHPRQAECEPQADRGETRRNGRHTRKLARAMRAHGRGLVGVTGPVLAGQTICARWAHGRARQVRNQQERLSEPQQPAIGRLLPPDFSTILGTCSAIAALDVPREGDRGWSSSRARVGGCKTERPTVKAPTGVN